MKRRISKRTIDALAAGPRDVFLWDTELAGFGCKVTPKGRKVYVLQYRTEQEDWKKAPRRITLGKHGELTAEQARRLANEFLREIRSGNDPVAKRRDGPTPSMAALAQRFLDEHLPSKKKPPRRRTVEGYESIFRKHIIPRIGTKAANEVQVEDVEKIHNAMRTTPYIANRTLSLLQQAFNQAERWGWRPQHSNPALHIDKFAEARRGSRKEVMLNPQQIQKLLRAIDEEEAEGVSPIACNAIRVAFWTGWRIGEVLALRWDNLDLENGVARLELTKAAEEEYRQVPNRALNIIKNAFRVAGCPFVFPGRLPKHLTTVKKPWQAIRKRAGLDDLPGLGPLRLHDLRHNVVSWDVSRGVPLEIAGKNVGHRSRRSTEVYAHFAPDALKKAADERAEAMFEASEGAPGQL